MNTKVFYFIFFLGGLGDLISTYYGLNCLTGFYEKNYYIPFMFTIILSCIFYVDFKLLQKHNTTLKSIGFIFTLFSFWGLLNNLLMFTINKDLIMTLTLILM